MVRHEGSGCPHTRHAGGSAGRTPRQQAWHTGPASGSSSTAWQAAQCGASVDGEQGVEDADRRGAERLRRLSSEKS